MRASLAVVLLGACAATASPPAGPNAVAWSDGRSDSAGVPDPVVCTDVVSHPCPWLLYTGRLVVDGAQATWTDASGGVNDIGVDASAYADVVEQPAVGEDGSLSFPLRGDDGGLRHAFVLHRTACGGWEADVSWSLFNVAGVTTFHLSVAP